MPELFASASPALASRPPKIALTRPRPRSGPSAAPVSLPTMPETAVWLIMAKIEEAPSAVDERCTRAAKAVSSRLWR